MTRKSSLNSIGYSGWVYFGILGVVLLLLPVIGKAEDYLYKTGFPTFTNAESVEMGIVNLANGNLHLEIPITSASQRGSLTYQAKLVYDSRIWKKVGALGYQSWSPTNVTKPDGSQADGGWRFLQTGAGQAGRKKVTKSCRFVCGPYGQMCTSYWDEYSDFYFIDWTGTKREFPIFYYVGNSCNTAPSPNMSGYAVDGSGYHMTWSGPSSDSFVVKAHDGTQVYPTMKDTNGNFFSTSGGNLVDTLGRVPLEKRVVGNITYFDILDSVNSSPRPYIKVTYTTVYYNTAFGQSGITEKDSGSFQAISSIEFPDCAAGPPCTKYQFTYDSGTGDGNYGLLKTVTLPTGGVITYTQTTNQDANGNRNRWVYSRNTIDGTSYFLFSTCGTDCQRMTVRSPDGNDTRHTFDVDNGAWTTKTESFQGTTSGTLLHKVEPSYKMNLADPVNGGAGYVVTYITTTTLPRTGGDRVSKSELDFQTFSYSYKGTNYTGRKPNLLERREFPFGDGSPGSLYRKITFTYGTYNRLTNTQVKDSGNNKKAETKITLDSTSLTSKTGVTNHDDTNYGTGRTTRGNPTKIENWDGSIYWATTLYYDTTGQVLEVKDPKLNSTTFSYANKFYTDNGNSPPSLDSSPPDTNAYLTLVDPPLSGTLSFGYYFNTGKLAQSVDLNSALSFLRYQDDLDRLTHTYGPSVNSQRGWTLTEYASTTQTNSYVSLTNATPGTSCSGCLKGQVERDGLGRIKKQKLVSDPQGDTITDLTYASGHLATTSHPYRGSVGGSESITYDGLGRPKTVTHPDADLIEYFYGNDVGSGGGRTSPLCSTGTYGYGFPTVVVDEAGNARQSWADAFGRIIEVDEPDPSTGSLTTGNVRAVCSKYDLLGNLVEVLQGEGSTKEQTRTYTYDALSRLTESLTPEEGTGSASSDKVNLYNTTSGGGKCSGSPRLVCREEKPAPNQAVPSTTRVTSTLTYDSLNRVTGVTFSNGDPSVTYTYDEADCLGLASCSNKGRRTTMSDDSGTTEWAYNKAGALLRERKTIGTVTKDIDYAYNVGGSLKSVTYPSGQVVDYTYSDAGRLLKLEDTDASYPNKYAESALYQPSGALTSVKHGQTGAFTGITRSFAYNTRLQLASIGVTSTAGTVLDLTYAYETLNNGSIESITNNLLAGRTQSFTYDKLNRVDHAETDATSGDNCWGQDHEYDETQWGHLGNLTGISLLSSHSGCSALAPTHTIDSENKITTTGITYYENGWMKTYAGDTFTWRASGLMKSDGTMNHTQDGDGWRTKKANSDETSGTLYWRSAGGALLAESNLSGTITREYIYFGSALIARRDSGGTVHYFFQDHLGSTRVITNATGSKERESDYLPFGKEKVVGTATVDDPHKFAGMYLDSESGLYFTKFRMYSLNLGRWLSPDPLHGSLGNPQSLNRYAYVLNNSINFIDPIGLQQNDPPTTGCGASGFGANCTISRPGGTPYDPGYSNDHARDPRWATGPSHLGNTPEEIFSSWGPSPNPFGVGSGSPGQELVWIPNATVCTTDHLGSTCSSEPGYWVWDGGDGNTNLGLAGGGPRLPPWHQTQTPNFKGIGDLTKGLTAIAHPIKDAIVSIAFVNIGGFIIAGYVLLTPAVCAAGGPFGCGVWLAHGPVIVGGGIALVATGVKYTRDVTIPSFQHLFGGSD